MELQRDAGRHVRSGRWQHPGSAGSRNDDARLRPSSVQQELTKQPFCGERGLSNQPPFFFLVGARCGCAEAPGCAAATRRGALVNFDFFAVLFLREGPTEAASWL